MNTRLTVTPISTSTESDSGRTGVSTQTDPVTSADASTSTSTQCGFNIQDAVGLYCTEVKTLRGKSSWIRLFTAIVSSQDTCRKCHRIIKAEVYNFAINLTHKHDNVS